MIKLQQAHNQIVIGCEVYDQRPNDPELLPAAIETHQTTLTRTTIRTDRRPMGEDGAALSG